MISWKRTNLPVFIGLVCSLLLHAGLLLPMMISTTTSQAQAQDLESRFDPEDFKRPEVEPLVPPEEETPLGLDIDTPSTLTWVGYEEYEEHIAALAKMDQAAFTDDPAAPPTPQVLADPTPPQETQETESQKTPEPTPSPAIELDPTQLLAMQNLMDMLGRLMPKPVQDEQEKPEEQETPPEKPSEKPQPEEQAEDTPAPKETEEEEDQPSESEPKPDQPQPSNPTPPKPPEEGDPADKESDATSIIEAPPEKWKTGKPLASPGLEIQTKRPEFTLLQLLTTAPRNPLCMINFGANGKPTEALIVESSGSSAMDSAIISSLYRWRARGKRLRELSKGQTAMVRIRIILRN